MPIPHAPSSTRVDCVWSRGGRGPETRRGRQGHGGPVLSVPSHPSPLSARQAQQRPLEFSGTSGAGAPNSFLKGQRADILGVRAPRLSPSLVAPKQPQTFHVPIKLQLQSGVRCLWPSGRSLGSSRAFLLSVVSATPGTERHTPQSPWHPSEKACVCAGGEAGLPRPVLTAARRSRPPAQRPTVRRSCC